MASRGLNKVMLIGHLGQDPEVRALPNGQHVANFTLATGEKWKDRNSGQEHERTEWHRVAIFGKLAEIVQQYVKKGSKLYIEGKLQTRKWQDQNGQDRYTTEIVVSGYEGQMQMLGRANGVNEPPAHTQSGGYNDAPRTPMPGPAAAPPIEYFDDDIPF